MNEWIKDLSELKGFHFQLIEALNSKQIFNLFDFLHYFPKKYEDRSSLLKLDEAIKKTSEDKNFITTIICQCKNESHFFYRNRKVKKFFFSDGDNELLVNAYNPYQKFQIGDYYILSGKLKINYLKVSLQVSAYEVFDQEAINSIHLGRIVPIYHGGLNINQKRIRNLIEKMLISLSGNELNYVFSKQIQKKYNFIKKTEALKQIHFPDDFSILKKAREALVYEEFYAVLKKFQDKNKTIQLKEKDRYSAEEKIFNFLATTGFHLTSDQNKALAEIIRDLKSDKIMNRLLQGDVGTGKTLIAMLIMYWAYQSGYQAILMVPTEVLAYQHYETFKKYMQKEKVDIILYSGHHSKRYKDLALIDMDYKKKLLIIGTHALIQEKVKYNNLKLVIIDEQHRFGVEQRKAIISKGKKVDFLSMTATPIPRSLSLVMFGDMKKSFLKNKPQSSKKVNCRTLLNSKKLHAYKFLLSRLKKGEQAYIVFSVIEESSNQKLTSLLKEYDRLKKDFFHSIPTGFIHGKIPSEEKEHIMKKFKEQEIKVLFSTTVLEVGIDHPNATLIIIESAHQFGLSQLHQLRGRVGRGKKEGYCYLLFPEDINEKTKIRLDQFSKINDGFSLAELDLKIRGPGELLGIKQSGIPEFKLAHLVQDLEILERVKNDLVKI